MTSFNRRPRRVIYNFVARCNMACTFCYVPFDGQRANADTAQEVLRRVLSWDIHGLVIGGGDPLIYDYTPHLIEQARNAIPKLFIQLDTNALGSSCERLKAVAEHVDLIGLPMDGFSRGVCAAMRRRATHGIETFDLARSLARIGQAVKVNTVVSQVNRGDVPNIRRAVEQSGARIWSLYQFWPIGKIAQSNAETHQISSAEFQEIVRHQRLRMRSDVVVEGSGAVSERAGSYFFVAPTGRAFCTTATGDSFIELGNVLNQEEAVLDEWRRHSDLQRNLERSEQREHVVSGSQLVSWRRRVGNRDVPH